jgi:hypothetical protein
MNPTTFATIIALLIFLAILINDMLSYPKEQQANEEWKVILKEWDRKEREMFDKQSWEARQKRFQQMGI